MVKAILFDFWGTVVENGAFSPVRQSWSIMRVNMPFSPFVQKFEDSFMTTAFADQQAAFAKVFADFDVPPRDFVIDKMIGVWNSNRLLAKPFPETVAVLEQLKKDGYKLALIANTDCFSVEPILEKFELAKYFDVIHVSYKNGLLKNNPETFKIVLKELGVKKEDAVMVGDSFETDIEGAQNAGVRAILVDRKERKQYPEKIKDLTELNNFLK